MQIMWQVVHLKLGPNVVASKPSPGVITAVVSAWSFLLATMDGSALDPKSWQESVSYFSTLLEKDDRSLRIAAGEALALIYEMGNLEKFCGCSKGWLCSGNLYEDRWRVAYYYNLVPTNPVELYKTVSWWRICQTHAGKRISS